MGTLRADTITDGAGTGKPDFSQGLTSTGSITATGGFDTTGNAGLATSTLPGIIARLQGYRFKRGLAGTLSGITSVMQSFTVVSGRHYFVYGQFMRNVSFAATNEINIDIRNNGTAEVTTRFRPGVATASGTDQSTMNIAGIVQASGTTIDIYKSTTFGAFQTANSTAISLIVDITGLTFEDSGLD